MVIQEAEEQSGSREEESATMKEEIKKVLVEMREETKRETVEMREETKRETAEMREETKQEQEVGESRTESAFSESKEQFNSS